jgi:formylglycine-generating enzyme required for sulfatase activity
VSADHTVRDAADSPITVPDPAAPTVTLGLPEPPSQLGGWRLGRKLGQGGMGAVHLAEREGRKGALKLMHPALAGTGDFRARFLRETEAMRGIRHPNVVELIDHGEDAGWLFLVMEYVNGGDLATHLRRRGQLFEKEAVAIAARACQGLAALHAVRVIHRDLKPENIFLVQGGAETQPKIGDLGMARHTDGDDRMTLSGTACGTPAYMAPEQIRGNGDLDARVDVYAMGATLFTLLTGRKPFEGNTIYVLTHEVLTKPLPDLRRFNPQLSLGVCAVIEKAMAKDREARHKTIDELRLDLERLAEGKQPVLSAVSPASLMFQEIAGAPAPRRATGSGLSLGESFAGISWGPFLRLGIPAILAVAVLSGGMWLLERKQDAAPAPDAGAATSGATPTVEQDAIGHLVRLPVGSAEARLRWCPPGTFVMGSPADEAGRADHENQHDVVMPRGFWMLEGEVSERLLHGLDGASASDLPAGGLSYETCQAWLDRLNAAHPRLGARLPSESEWEYACRAGTTTAYAVTDPPPSWCAHPGVLDAWKDGSFAALSAWEADAGHAALRPRMPGGANAWGLRDLHGNQAEWCLDRWDGSRDYDAGGAVSELGTLNIVRGGSWWQPPEQCRSAARAGVDPGEERPWLGFRFIVPGGQAPTWPP